MQQLGEVVEITQLHVTIEAAQSRRHGTRSTSRRKPRCRVFDNQASLRVDTELPRGEQEALRIGLAHGNVFDGDQQRRIDGGRTEPCCSKGNVGAGDDGPGHLQSFNGVEQPLRARSQHHVGQIVILQGKLSLRRDSNCSIVEIRQQLPYGAIGRTAMRERDGSVGIDPVLSSPGDPGPLHRGVGIDERAIHVEQDGVNIIE